MPYKNSEDLIWPKIKESKAKIQCNQERNLNNNTNHTAINFTENDFIFEETFSSFYLYLFTSSALDRRRFGH